MPLRKFCLKIHVSCCAQPWLRTTVRPALLQLPGAPALASPPSQRRGSLLPLSTSPVTWAPMTLARAVLHEAQDVGIHGEEIGVGNS